MQTVSALYNLIITTTGHWFETKVEIGGIEYGEAYFQDGYIGVSRGVFGDSVAVGQAVAAQIDITMLKPPVSPPRMAEIKPYVRVTDGERVSEWIQKGVFYIDTRSNPKDSRVEKLQITGYDAMLKAEADCDINLPFPATDIDVVRAIAAKLGVDVDSRTVAIMNKGYLVQYPASYSCRETLGYIAAMYAGCFIISDLGELLLVTVNGMPPETNLLIDNSGNYITFGGVRILV